MPPGSWTFHHHPLKALHALDQDLVTGLCRLVVRMERGEELSVQEQVWVRSIHHEIREVAHGRDENQG